ncbi:LysR family transcriptional regulator [Lactiplantibacillus garii]|uniref:LysR family transcriptional regulator n=1 Tax=Lactiplantibacillus garii TaxID=2306423 RepID=A0A3R8KKD5_9LACO|nr:LysR family transcriptional regulator [Lactiplantibacillus garii]RRK09762.1 LysR family transcriptional regulator [Lactiplantibacillus garii]
METRILHYFLTIARLGTISAAARELHVAQPTLSRQIQQLEAQLGLPLFNRERHRMVLTKAGLTYQLHVQQILTALERANQLVKNSNNAELTGTLSTGCVESNVTNWLAPRLVHFHHAHPHVVIDTYDADGNAIKDRLDQGLLEIGIVSTPINAAKYHAVRLPVNDRWGVAVPATSPWTKQASVDVAALVNQPLIVPHRSLVKTELTDWLQTGDQPLRIVGEYNLLTNAVYLAAAGLGTLVCIAGVTLPPDSGLTFIPFFPQHQLKHFLIWRKGVPLSAPAQALITFLKSEITTSVSE